MVLTILPLIIAGWVIAGIAADNRTERVDDQLSAALRQAGATYEGRVRGAQDVALALAQTGQVQGDSAQGNRQELEQLLSDAEPNGVSLAGDHA